MDYLPIFLDLRGRRGLVVGGGDAAARKAALMLNAGAWVHVVAPELSGAFLELAGGDRLIHLAAPFHEAHLGGMDVVFAASGDAELDRSMSSTSPRYAPSSCLPSSTAHR